MSAAHHFARPANDVGDVDDPATGGYRQFDEESFSEVLTYYGSANNLQVQRLTTYHRPLKIRTDSGRSRVREPGSIGIL